MKIFCEYCGSELKNTDEECPNCGAKNPNFQRTVSGTPKTIEELKAFCDSKGLKLDRMHVHLGEDFKEPKAFGIYKNEKNGHFVVYKNKANGQRAIRYDGTDEAYAVNELYLKIKDLLNEAKAATSGRPSSSTRRPAPKKTPVLYYIICIFFLVVIVGSLIYACIAAMIDKRYNGYYEHRGTTYYRHGSYWYEYDEDTESWSSVGDMSSRVDREDFIGNDYDNDIEAEEFPVDDYSSDWASDDDWDSDNDYDWNDSYDDYDWGGGDAGGGGWDSDWHIDIYGCM